MDQNACGRKCEQCNRCCELAEPSDIHEPFLWLAGILTGLSAIGSATKKHWGWMLVAVYTSTICLVAAFHVRKLARQVVALENTLDAATRNKELSITFDETGKPGARETRDVQHESSTETQLRASDETREAVDVDVGEDDGFVVLKDDNVIIEA